MLQQTQVDRVKGFYASWLKRFPTWKALAEASNADVLHAWAGLGYNRRALVLRDIARQIVERGEPRDREGWLALKGIGPYTASAVMAFAYKQPYLPIDTNIRRFCGRFLLGKTYPQPADDEQIQQKAQITLMGSAQAFDIPQAIFDVATMYCTKVPNCAACPMQKECLAAKQFLSGEVTAPKQMVAKAQETIHRNKKHPDRIYRGRILKLVRESVQLVTVDSIGCKIDNEYDDELDRTWLEAMINRLAADGMLVQKGKSVIFR